MPEMDIAAKLFVIALIGLLIGVIVVYHRWIDRRYEIERRASLPTTENAASGTPQKVPTGGDTARRDEETQSARANDIARAEQS